MLRELVPWTKTLCGLSALGAAPTTAVILAPTTLDRYVLGFAVANATVAVYAPTQLETTVGGIAICRLQGWVPGVAMLLPPIPLPKADSGLTLRDFGGGAVQNFHWTVVYADTPANLLAANLFARLA